MLDVGQQESPSKLVGTQEERERACTISVDDCFVRGRKRAAASVVAPLYLRDWESTDCRAIVDQEALAGVAVVCEEKAVD